MASFLNTSIDSLYGVGTQKASLLKTELGIFTYNDLLNFYPYRYEDRSQITLIEDIYNADQDYQVSGKVISIDFIGEGHKKRMEVVLSDGTGTIKLLWFKGINFFKSQVKTDGTYLIYGKVAIFNGQKSIVHPELEVYDNRKLKEGSLEGVYSLTEKLRKKFVNAKQFRKWINTLLKLANPHIKEFLPNNILAENNLILQYQAYVGIHFPKNEDHYQAALKRLKFNELFIQQLKLFIKKGNHQRNFKGIPLGNTELLTHFYNEHLPFELTNSQKKVIKEIFNDFRSGNQMNRLLQGDVGSGKTIVAFICMLVAIADGAQCCLMAPTEILAIQHYANLKKFADLLDIEIDLLTGSTPKKHRTGLHENLATGQLKILIGTHALLEDVVKFNNLAFVIIDEQHRFGVAQRAKLWSKNKNFHPHILVMTATPIPRTLAMTLEEGLDISEITELPAGRKPIKTVHRFENSRLTIFQFIKDELIKGRQAYIVYPLIEESATLDLNNLFEGYESICRAFPEYAVSIVHGKMKPKDKDYEMNRFKKGETQIMVSTTVIEVGVDVPNASIMLIENAERFGLAQLHQLRGRVGRGSEQSYCILLTSVKLSKNGRTRMNTLVRTNNGFEISQVDLELRGAGSIAGTLQSGQGDFNLVNLALDGDLLKIARKAAENVFDTDQDLVKPENALIKELVMAEKRNVLNWSKIS